VTPPAPLVALRALYARPGQRGDVERVATLLGQLCRLGDPERASEALAAFRARRGWCFRDDVRRCLDELAPARRATIEACRRWAEAALEGLQRASVGRP
jgi:hypothetical protein